MGNLTHFDDQGRARMVDVTDKNVTHRVAVAKGSIGMSGDTLRLIVDRTVQKGDVLSVAEIAGIMGAKRTSELIPLCHPLRLTGVALALEVNEDASQVDVTATVKTDGKTGVEMEALTAVSVACLTIYDMCKAVEKGMTIGDICLVKKTGGKSGTYLREGDSEA